MKNIFNQIEEIQETIEKIEEMLLQKNQLIMEQFDLEGQETVSFILEKLVWAMECSREDI